MQADNLDDAKKELEDWYLRQLLERQQAALKLAAEAAELCERFLQWREDHT